MTSEPVISFAGMARFLPLINVSLLCALIGAASKLYLENRKLSIQEKSGLRQEFIDEMHALRDEVRGLRTENGQLRDEVRQLHGIIDGMRRGAIEGSISTQRAVLDALPPEAVSPAIKAAGVRAQQASRRNRGS